MLNNSAGDCSDRVENINDYKLLHSLERSGTLTTALEATVRSDAVNETVCRPLPPIDADAFWAKVDKSAGPDGCWPWTAGRSRQYGHVCVAGDHFLAHRVAFALAKGALEPTALVCHHCDNPPCCNPAHLFAGSAADNARDMKAKGRGPDRARANSPRTHLSEDDVRTIRARRLAGESCAAIAADFSVKATTVSAIARGVNWRDDSAITHVESRNRAEVTEKANETDPVPAQKIGGADGSSRERREHTFSAPAHTEVRMDVDYMKRVEDARADFTIAAAAARMVGVVSSTPPSSKLAELQAFASAVVASLLSVGICRAEVREAYRDVVEAGQILGTRIWQAQRAVRFSVERDVGAEVAR